MSTPFKPLPLTELDAITWTDNWRNSSRGLAANSFLFDADEFRALLEEPGIKYVRLYVGLKLNNDQTLEEKLICVGADAGKKDMLQSRNPGGAELIYDFSHPCPPLCYDGESPLAGGAIDG